MRSQHKMRWPPSPTLQAAHMSKNTPLNPNQIPLIVSPHPIRVAASQNPTLILGFFVSWV